VEQVQVQKPLQVYAESERIIVKKGIEKTTPRMLAFG
jgi:hypothetical protein